MTDLRASYGPYHVHYNPFYEPSKHNGPLLPPAPALAPTIWPQFHLRWACPMESQARELEVQYRNMARKVSELQKAKEEADTRAKETTVMRESMAAEMRNEMHISSSAKDLANLATRETAAIKRALQSLGCKVQFSGDGDCIVCIETNPTEIPQKSLCISSKEETVGSAHNDEKSDLSVPVTVLANDVSNNPVNLFCESLCPLHTRDGSCRWPDAVCARYGSQLVGLKANFDAFDRLSIYDGYFKPE